MNDFTKNELVLLKYGLEYLIESSTYKNKIPALNFLNKVQLMINNYDQGNKTKESKRNLIREIPETDFQYAMAKSIAGQIMSNETCKENPNRVLFLAGLMINELIIGRQ